MIFHHLNIPRYSVLQNEMILGISSGCILVVVVVLIPQLTIGISYSEVYNLTSERGL